MEASVGFIRKFLDRFRLRFVGRCIYTTDVTCDGKPYRTIQHAASLFMSPSGRRRAVIRTNDHRQMEMHRMTPLIRSWESGGALPPHFEPMEENQAIKEMLIAMVDKEFGLEGE
jgi:hypothetical protein